MKKHLLVVSFVLIFLLAVGAVSAGDDYNFTDDSDALMASLDDNEQSFSSESNVFEDEAIVGVQENQPDVLSGDNDVACVNVSDVTSTENGYAVVPFDVTNPDGSLVSGGVNVTLSGEDGTVSQHIELNNRTGQANFTILDLFGIVQENGLNIKDIYDIINSSSNFTNLNVSEIMEGLADINAGWSVDMSSFIEGYNLMVNGTHVNSEKVIEGIKDILNGIKVNISDFVGGLGDMASAISVNSSDITKANDIFLAVLGGFSMDDSKLLDGILSSITVDKALFMSGLSAIMGDSSAGSISEILSGLGLKLSLKIEIEMLAFLAKKDATLMDAYNIGKEIWNYNGLTKEIFLQRLSKITDGLNITVSDLFNEANNPSSSSGFDKIIKSLSIDSKKLLGAIIAGMNTITFNETKVADELAVITGVDSSKLSKIIGGIAEIASGFKFNTANVIMGLMDIFSASSTSSNILKDVFSAISFDGELFSKDMAKILSRLNLTGEDISDVIHDFANDINLAIPDDFEKSLSDSLKADELNFTQIGIIFEDILAYNSLSTSKLPDLWKNHTINVTKLLYRVANHKFNVNRTMHMIFLVMHYIIIDYDKISAELGNSHINTNSSKVAEAISLMLKGASADVSKIISGINEIVHGIDFNQSDVIELADAIKNSVNLSSVSSGLAKIISAFDIINQSSVNRGLAEIVSAFSFERSSFYKGVAMVENSFDLNEAMIAAGIERVACGLGIDTAGVMAKFFAKYGYVATFKNHLAAGIYNITVTYIGLNGVSVVNDTAKLTVTAGKNTPLDFVASVDGYDVSIKGSLNPDAKGLVLLEIGDYDAYNLIFDGKVSFEDIFAPGIYDVKAVYSGSSKFNRNITSFSFTVRAPTEIVADSKVSTTYGYAKSVAVTLRDADGNPVSGRLLTVKFNGNVNTIRTDSNGQISIAVAKNMIPKTYAASITFAGDDLYVLSSGSLSVVVAKGTPKIIAKAKAFKRTVKTKLFAIALKNHKNTVMKNTKVYIKVNGKVYAAKTNSKGKATFKITKLNKKGSFTALVVYKGDKYYNKVSKKVKIVVK